LPTLDIFPSDDIDKISSSYIFNMLVI